MHNLHCACSQSPLLICRQKHHLADFWWETFFSVFSGHVTPISKIFFDSIESPVLWPSCHWSITSLRRNPKSVLPVSHRDWLALSAFLLCVCVCVQVCLAKIGGQPISPLLHTQRERGKDRETEPCYTPPQGFASPQGCWGNGPAAHTAEWNKPGWKERMNGQNEWVKCK